MHVLSRLPSSLILILLWLTTLQLAASSPTRADFVVREAPPDAPVPDFPILELNPDTFKKTISKGYWFIEHFSPFCGHCRNFAPTWKTLVHEAKTDIPNVSMATVNCAVHGDLCADNGVTGYPELKLYKSGELFKTFHDNRDLPTLKQFLLDNAPNTPPPPPPSVDKALESEISLPTLNPDGQVESLNPSTFDSFLAKGPMFVKFYAPWCGHCKKLAPRWAELATETKNGQVTIAEVNCEDYADLCKSYHIEGYPTLLFFGSDKRTTEYKSGRQLAQMLSFVKKASAPSLRHLKTFDDLQTHVKKYDILYLLLFSTRPPKEVFYAFKDAATALLGQPPVFYTSNPKLVHHYGVSTKEPWALVALKDHEMNIASSMFLASYFPSHPDDSSSSSSYSLPQHIRDPTSQLSTWLRTHRLPTALELTQDTFQSVMNAPEAPLVVIAAVPPALKPAVEKRIGDLVAMWKTRTGGSGRAKKRKLSGDHGHGGATWIGTGEEKESVRGERGEREVLLTWMDAERWKDWLQGMYGIAAVEGVDALNDVPVVIVDHKRLVYWDQDSQGNQLGLSKRILDAVQDVVDGKIRYKHSESMIERLARTLSNGLVGIEHFVAEHMFMSLMFVVGGLMAVFWIAKRFVLSEVNQGYKRIERLD